MLRAVILVALVLALTGCKTSETPRINESHWLEKGAEVVLPFKMNLKEALVAAMAEKGPVEAISACQLVAPKLTEGAASSSAKVGRTSHKLRNPANAPKPWMQPLLQGYLDSPTKMEPRVVLINDQTVGYVEAIYVQPMCVTCHGSEIAPEVQKKLTELYPNDEAAGFQPGDFRGLFWVELDRN